MSQNIYWTRYLMTGHPSDYRTVITTKDIVDPDTFQSALCRGQPEPQPVQSFAERAVHSEGEVFER